MIESSNLFQWDLLFGRTNEWVRIEWLLGHFCQLSIGIRLDDRCRYPYWIHHLTNIWNKRVDYWIAFMSHKNSTTMFYFHGLLLWYSFIYKVLLQTKSKKKKKKKYKIIYTNSSTLISIRIAPKLLSMNVIPIPNN